MDAESQPVNLKKSWISAHPRVLIGVILIVCLGPFLNKAIHTDDALFVWTGQWIQKHPTDFFGFKVNEWFSAIPMWKANWNPPLMSYFLAGVASLFGWNEIVLHLAGLAVAFAAATGIYSLAKMWCDRPLLAAIIAMFTPAFLVSSSTLMCDVLILTFWIWALVLWERALASRQSRWRFVGAGVFAGLAVLTKYSALTLLPLLPILGILRTRKLGWWWLGLAVPLIMVAGYEWITAKMYGTSLLSATIIHTTHRREFPAAWEARGIIGLAFAGGCLLPLLFFAPFLWRPKTLLAGGVVIFGLWLGIFYRGSNLGLIPPWGNPELMNHSGFALQVMLLTVGGLHLLFLTGVETWHKRDINSVMLALWIISGLFSAIVLNFAVNARSFLLIVPAAAILLVRRLGATRGNPVAGGWLLWPLIPSAAIALGITAADYQLANSARTAATLIVAKYKSSSRQLWFQGHWGFQYYMEKLGGQPIDVERSLLQPGDIVVVSEISAYNTLPAGSVGWIEDLKISPFSWMNLMDTSKSGAAGFYGAYAGPVPFAIGILPLQYYDLVRVFSRLQFNAQPANPREVQAGGLPSFSSTSVLVKDKTVSKMNPEAMKQFQVACQLEANGKIEEAIRQYRNALSMDSNNPVVLNSLAWILATAAKPELRKGEEAVQLAARAVEQTDYRQPLFIGTLAAAYAQAGRFPQACEMARTARALALITNQNEIAANNEKLLSLYSAGKTVDETYNP